LLYSAESTPVRVQKKLTETLGERATGLTGEKCIGPKVLTGFANSAVRVVYQPGILTQIANTRPDVVVGEGFFQWTSFVLAYSLWKSMPLVVCYERTFHTERHAQWYRTAYRRVAMRFISAMACNGRLCAEYTQWLGMPRGRITIGNFTADIEGLSRQADGVTESQRRQIRQSWDAEGLVFLYVGQMNARKGVDYLLEAWGMLERVMEGQATLVLVGSGPEEDRLRAQARGLGLKGIRFLGAVDYDELAPYYASADAFVIPTLEDNWSLVVPEAMACGLPILCSKYNGCWPEFAQEGRNGWVFDPLDVQNLFRCLQRCVQAKDRLNYMGEESKAIVSDHSPFRAAQSIFKACEIAMDRKTTSVVIQKKRNL
jgi:glycosyltransferase involved in cell wall biosynthesis